MSTSVQELFNISDQLAKNLEITHKLAVPKMTKIVINAGIGTIKEDNKAIEKMKKDLSLITGQAPVVRLSKKP
jgi:large subunit ribosomal protein L5